MIPQIQQAIFDRISSLCAMSPDIRMGQMFANLGILSEAFANQSLWDIEDDQLLKIIEIHHAQLTKRISANTQKEAPGDSLQKEVLQTET